MRVPFGLTVIVLLVASCAPQDESLSPEELAAYRAEIEQWQDAREERLREDDSWLTLVGLHWLIEGHNEFGTDPRLPVVFPEGKMLARAGTFELEDGTVRIVAEPGAGITHEGEPVRELTLAPDTSGEPTVLEAGSLVFYLIERAGEFAIRVKDRESELLTTFEGIEEYPIDPSWRIRGQFEPYDPPKPIEVPNITGQINEAESPGAIVFERNGETHRVDVLDASDSYWVIFADETNGGETYGGGRFLYTELPEEDGSITIDFNRAYNPPCVFTVYATCPLPPEENTLALAVTAGEKMFHGGLGHE